MLQPQRLTIAGMVLCAHISFDRQLVPPKKTIYLQVLSMPSHDLMQALFERNVVVNTNLRVEGELEVKQFLNTLADIFRDNVFFSGELVRYRRQLNTDWQKLSTQYLCQDSFVF